MEFWLGALAAFLILVYLLESIRNKKAIWAKILLSCKHPLTQLGTGPLIYCSWELGPKAGLQTARPDLKWLFQPYLSQLDSFLTVFHLVWRWPSFLYSICSTILWALKAEGRADLFFFNTRKPHVFPQLFYSKKQCLVFVVRNIPMAGK